MGDGQPSPAYRLLYIKVRPQTVVDRGSLYEAVRWAWRVKPDRAEAADWVVAVVDGICSGMYEVHRWETSQRNPGRYEFVGRELDGQSELARQHIGKPIPDQYRRRGMANPVLYGW